MGQPLGEADFTSADEVHAYITAAIESGDADARDYDLDGIATECWTWDFPAQAFIMSSDVDEFWLSVERHCRQEV